MSVAYSYSELKATNPQLYTTIQNNISKAYSDYVFISDDEMATVVNPQRLPHNTWMLRTYPPILTIELPVVTPQDFTRQMRMLMHFFTISAPRWKWFTLSPFYQQTIDAFMSFPQVKYQSALFYMVINYITDPSNKYTSLSNILKKHESTNAIIHDLYNYVWYGEHSLTSTIAFNPDNSVSLLTRLCG